MAEWEHPELGAFRFDSAWLGTATLPVFSKFASMESSASETVEILIDAYKSTDIPSDGVVRVAINTISNADSLVKSGLQVLFDDFHGIRPDSGMWWHDEIDHVCEILDNRFSRGVLDTADGLYELLGDASLLIQGRGYGYDSPCAVIGFESPIDVEHGVGFLTDGAQIIGLGYRADPCAFEE